MDRIKILKRKIREYKKTSDRIEKMGDYKSKDEVDFAILALEELLETYETGIECDVED